MIEAFAIYGVKKSTVKSAIKNTKINNSDAKNLTHARIHTKVQVIFNDIRIEGVGMMAAMDDAKNMIYQHNVVHSEVLNLLK